MLEKYKTASGISVSNLTTEEKFEELFARSELQVKATSITAETLAAVANIAMGKEKNPEKIIELMKTSRSILEGIDARKAEEQRRTKQN